MTNAGEGKGGQAFSIGPVDRKPANLRQIELPAGHLFLSPDYACCVQSVGPSFVALIGHCIDLDRPDAPESDVASSLLQRAMRDGIDAMLAAIDYLVGRFAAIVARRLPQVADIPINPRPRRTFGQLAAGAYRQLKRRVPIVRAVESRLRH